jgi:predicted acetyltransferase
VPIEIRAIDLDELDKMMLVDERGFGGEPNPEGFSRSWAEGELDRTRVALDGDEMVGVSRAYSFEVTLPGGAMVPAAAVSWVAVLPTHRRQGVLTRMIAALHDDAREREEPVGILTASESHIYERFGYGIATWRLGLTTEKARIQFREPGTPGRMRMVTREEAEKVLPAIYEYLRPLRAGAVSRPDFWWPTVYFDQVGGQKKKAFFWAVHTNEAGVDDGWIGYEITGDWNGGVPDRDLVIWDMQAADADVRTALWRYAYSVDLIGTVRAHNLPIDDPLRHLVVDSRRVRVDFINDGLWLAPLDSARLLSARTYAQPGRLVFAVHAPDGSVEVLALDADESGTAQCAPTTDEPDVVLSSAVLGACALGGNRFTEFADARRLSGNRDALLRADRIFACTPPPVMLSWF